MFAIMENIMKRPVYFNTFHVQFRQIPIVMTTNIHRSNNDF